MVANTQVAKAQAAAKAPDTLVFTNGEQITGDLESADSSGIKFKSPMVGEITVVWANIKSLDTSKSFAVIPKNVKLTRRDAVADVPQGAVAATGKDIVVTAPAGSKNVPVADTNLLMPTPDFLKAVHSNPGILHGWAGLATGGVSLVRATQNSTTFNGAIGLVRAEPSATWLPPRSRTSLDYNQSYGTVTQPGVDEIKTNIFHADAERDEYFSPRLFAFGNVAFDHNFSQSLDLQQAYGGGIGITLIKSPVQQLDLRADVHYEKQEFFDTTVGQNENLVGSTFAETYVRHLQKGILLNEFGSVSPAWNNSNAYSAHVNASLVFPVYKGLGFNVTAIDDYLNNAPVGTNQNSTQFNVGVTYTIKPR
ncbi:DUF481 domain-containing protein [Granulicella sp. WH15]|uniref:DUF481 domain-containing protein n=1 Tax=Granulicella sp. WH15 TaxID=2602070 RepID=UPI0013A542EA|nr:DUF481 domain-containing protein [Granulicella sp. WH15]